MKILPTILLVIAVVSCKAPVKEEPTPAGDDSIIVMAKIPRNSDLSKIDLSKVVISSQPISLYTKDIEALKKQNVAQDSIILIITSNLNTITASRRRDSLQIGAVKKQTDSLKRFIDTTALYPNTSQFDFANHILSIKGKNPADTLVRQ